MQSRAVINGSAFIQTCNRKQIKSNAVVLSLRRIFGVPSSVISLYGYAKPNCRNREAWEEASPRFEALFRLP